MLCNVWCKIRCSFNWNIVAFLNKEKNKTRNWMLNPSSRSRIHIFFPIGLKTVNLPNIFVQFCDNCYFNLDFIIILYLAEMAHSQTVFQLLGTYIVYCCLHFHFVLIKLHVTTFWDNCCCVFFYNSTLVFIHSRVSYT